MQIAYSTLMISLCFSTWLLLSYCGQTLYQYLWSQEGEFVFDGNPPASNYLQDKVRMCV